MRLNVVQFTDFDLRNGLLHRLLNEIQTSTATFNLISFENVLEVGSDATLHVGCYLDEVLAFNDSAQFLAQVLICTLDDPVLHLD